MQKLNLHWLFYIAIVFISQSCASTNKIVQTTANISSIKFIGDYIIPFNATCKQSVIGGLSGIDYDAANRLYYLISDDRNDLGPVRFYTAKIFFSPGGIDSVVFMDVKNILQPDGNIYPDRKKDPLKNPDPEAIRYNPLSNQLVWSSEGERVLNLNDTILVNPTVISINKEGNYTDSFALPENMVIHATENGPRRNGVFEGMSFADHYKSLYVNTEEPLYVDGLRADIADNNSFIRIIKFDTKQKRAVGQYAYKLEPVAHQSIPASAFKINGVPDILSLGNNKLLVIERSFSTGIIQNTIRLFIADLNGATDISLKKLKDKPVFIPAKKTWLLNMDDLGIYTDNIEGVTFGPLLPNGHKTLIFIADNNFNNLQKSQLLLFEVLE